MPVRWLVPKIGDGPSAVAARLRAEGHEVVELTVGRIVPLPAEVPAGEWLVVTSRHAVPAIPSGCAARVAVIGKATAAAVEAAGFAVAFRPSSPDSATFVREFAAVVKPQERVVRLKARNAADSLAALAACSQYCAVDVYENALVPLTGPIDLSRYDAAYFTCPSAVERVFAVSTGTTACHAIGPTTAARLSRLGVCPHWPDCVKMSESRNLEEEGR